MIVQVVNIGNITANQFDVMIPLQGVGANNACSTQFGSSVNLGNTNGGVLSTCESQSQDYNTRKTCVQTACGGLSSVANSTDLVAGCNWFVDWFGIADNPSINYKPVSCPSAITSRSGLQ
jgi:hypothetical protein